MSKRVVYHGGGYIGFTGAAYFARAGVDVLICDPNPEVVEKINSGVIPVYGVKEFLRFDPFSTSGEIKATTRSEDALDEKIHLIAVPTERDGKALPDIARAVLRLLLERECAGRVILMESTVGPGFTDEHLSEDDRTSIIACDGAYAICPRRDWFVDPNDDVALTPRVVGGLTPSQTEKAVGVLSMISRTIHRTGYKEAEAVKAVENAIFYHSITFGLEFAKRYYGKLDVREVLRLQGTHWRLYPLYPSAGIAGYCVPMGYKYLDMPHLRAVDEKVEDYWRDFVCVRAADLFQRNAAKWVWVYGISEKEGTRVPHFSPAFTFWDKMRLRGFDVTVADGDYQIPDIQSMFAEGSAGVLSRLHEQLETETIGLVVVKPDSHVKKFLRNLGKRAGNLAVFDCWGVEDAVPPNIREYNLLGR